MKKKLIIFGAGKIAQLAHYYFYNDSDYEVVCFTVDQQYITETSFCSLPVIPFKGLNQEYGTADHDLFVALSYSDLNEIRKNKYLEAKAQGYAMASYISSHATILNDRNIGENCFILEDNTIQPYAIIGNNVTLWSGNHIGHHSIIGDHSFISSHVVVSGGVEISDLCFLGVNSTIRDHVSIGSKTIVGAGALILHDLPAESLVKGAAGKNSSQNSASVKKI